jgi:hypothetical protein
MVEFGVLVYYYSNVRIFSVNANDGGVKIRKIVERDGDVRVIGEAFEGDRTGERTFGRGGGRGTPENEE